MTKIQANKNVVRIYNEIYFLKKEKKANYSVNNIF